MLSRIFIQNFALIDKLDINLHKGLQVITGETGAGKSIILGALRLILGERADSKSLNKTTEKSIVETEFQIKDDFKPFFDEKDLDFDTNTIIRREILPGGKSRAFINDVPVTLDVLKELSSRLIDIHSQFETSALFTEAFQFRILDGLAKNDATLLEYQTLFKEYQDIKKEIELLKTELNQNNKESDYKDFLLNELLEIDLDNIDFEELQNQLNTQENAGQIGEQLSDIIKTISADEFGTISQLSEARNKLQKTTELSKNLEALSQRLDEIFFELKDIATELENECEKVETNPELLEHLLSKINKINSLFLKHQVSSIEDLIEIRNGLSNNQNSLENLENKLKDLESKALKTEEKLLKFSKFITQSRQKNAKILEKKASEIFAKLGLAKATLQVDLSESNNLNLFGKDNIQLLFKANSGFAAKPIQSAISGGERSRVMLAVKKIMAENNALPTLILDEIDTGVSGRIAEEMGILMKEMANDLQLIVITHLAQVAAKGNKNYKVVKKDSEGVTKTNIVQLNDEEKLHEIAQLISGSKITDAAILQAKELML